MESVNAKVDEYFELNEDRKVQEPKGYRTLIYCYEGMPVGEHEFPTIEKVFVIVESHPIVVESHSDIELHIDVEH